MPRVCYLPDHRAVEALRDETLLEASLREAIPHAHACGGHARCSTCRVLIVRGIEYCSPPNDREQIMSERLHLGPQIRLACQTRVSGEVEIRRLVLDEEDEELTDQLGAKVAPAPVGEEKLLAILFADIRGFTSFAERLPAYDVVHVLNRYFHQVGQAITRNRGEINNYIGDGLMALFGLDCKGDAAMNAIRAALDMLDAVARLRPYLENVYTQSFQIGIGVHLGEVVIGSIGHDQTRRMTAIGDAVNFASRIESANKQAGTRFLISEETFNEVRDLVRVGKSVELSLAGKSGCYTLYEVIGLK
jgi:adenylate cyclase